MGKGRWGSGGCIRGWMFLDAGADEGKMTSKKRRIERNIVGSIKLEAMVTRQQTNMNVVHWKFSSIIIP